MSAQQTNGNGKIVAKKVTTKNVLKGLWQVTSSVAKVTIVVLGIGAAITLTRGAVLDVIADR